MIKFEGAAALNKALSRVINDFPKERDRFLRMEAQKVKGRVVPKTPADTGRLRGAWATTEPEGGEISIYNNTDYAAHIEFGHRVKIHGKFTGSVVPGAYMLRDGVEESAAEFSADATQILARLLK